ncbi:NAD(P)-dependent oxidoreductase [Mycobacterium sp.]|uniref:NAD(P)-dependent oxidoreductase n=1 Tax=Mycobacterium sp. TaxID=1785 RepID=UPI0025D448DF|nr:NAD(P)-dependent oxidoreductase [Mycobacterium sp.]
MGFVGLGDQGEPMAQRILDAGHDLAVFARRPEQAEALISRGAVSANSLSDLADRSELLGVCVGTDADVHEVAAAVVGHMRPGSVLAVHSTVDPQTCISIGADASAQGVAVIDAPVSGGRARAAAGELTVMVGGEVTAVEKARPVFESFGAQVMHVGELGAGEVLKFVNNYLFAAQVSITAQAIELCGELGLDVAQSMTAIASSTGSSRTIQMFVDGGCRSAFPIHSAGRARGAELLAKDIGLVDSLLAGRSVPELLYRAVRAGLLVAAGAEPTGDDL